MARIISSRQSGQPSVGVPRESWPLRPIRLLRQRSIKRAMVHDPSNGATQPEFKNLLGGIALATRNVKQKFQTPLTPPSPNAGQRVVRQGSNRIVKR